MPQPKSYIIDKLAQNAPVSPLDTISQQEDQDRIGRHKRRRREENTMHWAFVLLVWAVSFSVLIAFLLNTWHVLAPGSLCWLGNLEIQKVQQFLTTGVLSGTAGAIFQTKFENNLIK
jgi:hypothetical protein